MNLERLFGGHPLVIILRLVAISVVVGVIMTTLGIHPAELFYHLDRLARRLYEMGFGAIEWAARYFLIGAVVVIPIWLLARLFGLAGRRGPRDGER
ncbi:MAG: DUF6460 domain-containing protein [Hyphomicrobiaceae bacterium]